MVQHTSESKARSAKFEARAPKSSGVVVPQTPAWHRRAGAWLVFALIRAVAATLRYQWTDRSGFFNGPPAGPAIYCVWHNRLALSMTAYFRYIRKHNQTSGLAVMVSASKDGGFLAAILKCFKVEPVRGSSSRRGRQALLELTTWAERGYDLALTPDGPRGPRYVAQDGAIALGQITGLPVLPVSYHLGWKITAKSWDGFQVPIPFSRCEMIYEKPIAVPREASDAERELLRAELEKRLRLISKD